MDSWPEIVDVLHSFESDNNFTLHLTTMLYKEEMTFQYQHPQQWPSVPTGDEDEGSSNGSNSNSSSTTTTTPSNPSTTTTTVSSSDRTEDAVKAVDDSLTNLNWLHNLNIMGGIHVPTPPTPPASPSSSIADVLARESGGGKNANRPGGRPRISQPPENVDYRVNGDVKPPYSYATLICMAMKANKNKMTLSAIYKWIRDNFLYYKKADPSWQNSIRHNLSLNKCFIKVPRSKDEPGKGGFWRLDPEYAESLVDGVFKKRRVSTRSGQKRVRKEVLSKAPTVINSIATIVPTSNLLSTTPTPTLSPPSVDTLNLMSTPMPSLHALPQLPTQDDASAASLDFKGDFCWNSILAEDLDPELRYQSEFLLNTDMYKQLANGNVANSETVSATATVGSPPLDVNSLAIEEDLFGSDTNSEDCGQTAGLLPMVPDPLDLTVQGTHIPTPEWWRLTGNGTNVNGNDLCTQMALATSLIGQLNFTIDGEQPDYNEATWADESKVAAASLEAQLDLEGLIDLDGIHVY